MTGMQRNTIQSYSLLRMEILPPSTIILLVSFMAQGPGPRLSQRDWQIDCPTWDSEDGGVSLSPLHLDSVSSLQLKRIDAIGLAFAIPLLT
jgi:hypothetical protein